MHIIRTYSAGVHVGTLASRAGKEVVLKNASRIWRWRGANTLHELALHGPAQEYTRISECIPEITLTEAIEVIECSQIAADAMTPRWGK
jgi:hypothetical protein